jgi:cardiolipin synthase
LLRHLPNALTIGRMLAVAPIGWWLSEEDYTPAVALFLLAAVTDAVDGALARAYGWQSQLGGVLDPVADKLLMLVCASVLWWQELLPAWLFGLMLGRDVLIVSGALAYHRLVEPFQAQPSALGKLCTALQALLLLTLMLHQGGWPGGGLIQPLIGATAFALVGSAVAYVYRYTRQACLLRRRRS